MSLRHMWLYIKTHVSLYKGLGWSEIDCQRIVYPIIPLGRIQIPPRALTFLSSLCGIKCCPRDQRGVSDWTKWSWIINEFFKYHIYYLCYIIMYILELHEYSLIFREIFVHSNLLKSLYNAVYYKCWLMVLFVSSLYFLYFQGYWYNTWGISYILEIRVWEDDGTWKGTVCNVNFFSLLSTTFPISSFQTHIHDHVFCEPKTTKSRLWDR